MRLFARFTGGRLRSAANLVVAIFLLASAVMPFTHHSVECHGKSLAHCTACTVGSSANAPHVPAAPLEVGLVDAGEVDAPACRAPEFPSLGQSSGRAPPVLG
ncbi:MAG TPA: hypothetical protein VH740_00025 [Vicinamibacterales bacterium]